MTAMIRSRVTPGFAFSSAKTPVVVEVEVLVSARDWSVITKAPFKIATERYDRFHRPTIRDNVDRL
jgi:hypothetical protein